MATATTEARDDPASAPPRRRDRRRHRPAERVRRLLCRGWMLMSFTMTDPVALLAQIEEAAVALRAYSDDNRSDLGDVLSPSQVRGFLDCSARWWYKYGLGLPDPAGASPTRWR